MHKFYYDFPVWFHLAYIEIQISTNKLKPCKIPECITGVFFHLKLYVFIINLFLFLFSYNCLHFLPIPPPHPSQFHLPPPWFCPCALYSSSYRPLSLPSPPHSPLAIVTLFLTSMSLVTFCLLYSFVDYVPVKGEIIWYLSLPPSLFHLP